jgi:hypothetical protein
MTELTDKEFAMMKRRERTSSHGPVYTIACIGFIILMFMIPIVGWILGIGLAIGMYREYKSGAFDAQFPYGTFKNEPYID